MYACFTILLCFTIKNALLRSCLDTLFKIPITNCDRLDLRSINTLRATFWHVLGQKRWLCDQKESLLGRRFDLGHHKKGISAAGTPSPSARQAGEPSSFALWRHCYVSACFLKSNQRYKQKIIGSFWLQAVLKKLLNFSYQNYVFCVGIIKQ